MQVKDIMSVPAITVGPETTVSGIAALMLEKRISAVPVVDAEGKPIGIVSEGDLVRRPETGTERPTSWWLELFTNNQDRARDYVKTHGLLAHEVMSRPLITVTEDDDVEDVVRTLEKHHIKRVAVVSDGRIVGMVSRANLLRAFVSHAQPLNRSTGDDKSIRSAVLQAIEKARLDPSLVNVIVTGGKVHLWGLAEGRPEREALAVAAEEVVGPDKVENNVRVMPPFVRATHGIG